MANNIQLFGEKLLNFKNTADLTEDNIKANGFAYNDTAWNTATDGFSTICKTGFIPNTPASSVALNTALRQSSFTSYILGEVLAKENLITPTGLNVSTDNLNNANTLINSFTEFLNKINGLINGLEKANYALTAKNYDQSSGNIKEKFDEIETDSNNLSKCVFEGLNYTYNGNVYNSVWIAKNYDKTINTDGSINNKINNFETRIKDLEKRMTKDIYIERNILGISGFNITFNKLDSVIYFEGHYLRADLSNNQVKMLFSNNNKLFTISNKDFFKNADCPNLHTYITRHDDGYDTYFPLQFYISPDGDFKTVKVGAGGSIIYELNTWDIYFDGHYTVKL